MGELAEDYNFMKKVREIERAKKEPQRLDYAVKQLEDAGHTVRVIDDQSIKVNGKITLWVYTGWYSGKGVGSGRGVHQLIEKLDEE